MRPSGKVLESIFDAVSRPEKIRIAANLIDELELFEDEERKIPYQIKPDDTIEDLLDKYVNKGFNYTFARLLSDGCELMQSIPKEALYIVIGNAPLYTSLVEDEGVEFTLETLEDSIYQEKNKQGAEIYNTWISWEIGVNEEIEKMKVLDIVSLANSEFTPS